MPAEKPNSDLIDHTLRIFQPRTSRRLTRDDGREIKENLTGFYRVLLDWDRKARQGGDDDSQ